MSEANESDPTVESNDNSGVPDVSTSKSKESHDPATAHKRANEVMNSLIDGRSVASSITFETPHGPIECDINLNSLDLKTRWDCVKALPDGMFRAADNADEDGEAEIGENVELEADIIPGGDGMVMMRLVILEVLDAHGLSDGELKSVIKNDLPDRFLIDIGMRILEMSLDRGEITGFRLD